MFKNWTKDILGFKMIIWDIKYLEKIQCKKILCFMGSVCHTWSKSNFFFSDL